MLGRSAAAAAPAAAAVAGESAAAAAAAAAAGSEEEDAAGDECVQQDGAAPGEARVKVFYSFVIVYCKAVCPLALTSSRLAMAAK